MNSEAREAVKSWSPAIRLPKPLFDRLTVLRDARRVETGRKSLSYAEVIEQLLERASS
jgi:hypothetical protein